MPLTFQADQSVPDNLRRLFTLRLTRVTGALARPPHGDLLAVVHGVRKDLKRLRALLRLARPGLPRRVFAAEMAVLRDAARALGAVRDAQVLGETFALLTGPGHAGISAGTVKAVSGELAADLAAAPDRGELPTHVPAVLASLTALASRATDWPLADGDWKETLGAGLDAAYRRGRRDLRAILRAPVRAPEDEAWHDLRKRVKDLGYQLAPLHPLWPRLLKATIAELDALAEALGGDHDLALLRVRVLGRPKPWKDPGEPTAFAALVDARRAELQAAALAGAGRLYAERPGPFTARLGRLWRTWRRGEVAHGVARG